jgi:hypothetical protein
MERAETLLLHPPAQANATFSSSLSGVATWSVYGTSESPTAMVEGMDGKGKLVVAMAAAVPQGTAEGTNLALAFEVAPELGYDWPTVAAAIHKDGQAAGMLRTEAVGAPDAIHPLDENAAGGGTSLVSSGGSLTCPSGWLIGGATGCAVTSCLLAETGIGGAVCVACSATAVGSALLRLACAR